MKYKNYNKLPVKISTLLPKVFEPIKRKNNGVLLEIKLSWEKILGSNLSSICFVDSIRNINGKQVLTIVSDNRDILEISYCSKEIKDKINGFFSCNVIDEIKFKKTFQY